MKTYKIDTVTAIYRKDGKNYIASFYINDLPLRKDPFEFWDVSFNKVSEIKKYADNLSCTNFYA